MIELYAWDTPNGRKPLILLEELGVPYELKPVDLGRGEQKSESFTRLNPVQKIPALVDTGDSPATSLFESGAILLYLADKFERFLERTGPERYRALSWLMFQLSGVGPMLGQRIHFMKHDPDEPYANRHFIEEAKLEFQILDKRLAESEYLAGDYSIADMATFPWMLRPHRFGTSYEELPNLHRWVEAIRARDAVKRAMAVQFS
jgi:GST-like protein